ncbi:MAG: hypothetical protein AAGF99_00420 [Bacteroidota bacterium]
MGPDLDRRSSAVPQSVVDYRGGFMAAGAEHPVAAEMRQRYERYALAQQEWAKQTSEDTEFVFNAHWTVEQAAEMKDRGHLPMSIPVLYQLVDQAVSMLTANRPLFQTAAREDSDAQDAKLRSDLLAWMWEQSGGNAVVFRPIAFDFYVQARGVGLVYVDSNADYGRGEVRFASLAGAECFPDPNSVHPLWDDAQDVVVRRVMTAAHLQVSFPEWNPRLATQANTYDFAYGSTGRHYGQGQQLFQDQILHDETLPGQERYEVLERYEKVKVPHFRVRLPDRAPGDEKVLSEAEFAAEMRRPAWFVTRGEPFVQGIDEQTGEPVLGVSGPLEAVTDEQAVRDIDELATAMMRPAGLDASGGIVFHMRIDPKVIGPDGQPGPPQPAPGPAFDEDPLAVPGSTTRLEPVTVRNVIDRGLGAAKRFLLNRIRVTATAGGQLLYAPFDLPTEHFPVVPFNNNHARTPYPISDVRLVRDLQLGINKTNATILAHGSSTASQKVFYPEGSVRDAEKWRREWRRPGEAFIPYDPSFNAVTGGQTGGIVVASPQPLPSGFYANRDWFVSMMQQVLGLFPLSQGDAQMSPETFRGTVQIDEFAMRRIKSKMDVIYASLARMGRIALDYAAKLYTEEKVIRLMQPDGEVVEQTMNVLQYDDFGRVIGRFADVTRGHYDVTLVAGSTLPSNRWAILEQYLQLYDRDLVDQVAVLKRAEIPDSPQILERTGAMQQMQAQIEQMAEEIQRLQGDLQTREREAYHAKQAAMLAQHRAKLTQVEHQARAAGQVFGQTLNQQAQAQQVQLSAQAQIERERLRQGGGAPQPSQIGPSLSAAAPPVADPFAVDPTRQAPRAPASPYGF